MSGLSLFCDRFCFNWHYFFLTEINSNLKLCHLFINWFLFSSSFPKWYPQRISTSLLQHTVNSLDEQSVGIFSKSNTEKESRTSKTSDKNLSLIFYIMALIYISSISVIIPFFSSFICKWQLLSLLCRSSFNRLTVLQLPKSCWILVFVLRVFGTSLEKFMDPVWKVLFNAVSNSSITFECKEYSKET